MTRSLALINAPVPRRYRKSSRTGTYPPLSIASLASFVLQADKDLDVCLCDGEIANHQTIWSVLDAEVVGISCNIITYSSALEIASAAAAKGSRVILGGPFPTSMPERILRNRPYVDAVAVGDGEIALQGYIENWPYETIPNLCFRNRGRIVRNCERTLDPDSLPFPNYGGLPLESYFEKFGDRYGDYKPFARSLGIYSRKGCIWRDASNGGCVFCMIPHKGVRYKSPHRFWQEIEFFARQYGVDFFWEFSDTFTENSHWIRDFLRTRPDHLDVAFSVYGRPNNISMKMARMLKDLGVYEVFVGAESGDDGILTLMNKGITVDQTRRSVERLAAVDISVVVSFVLGLPGETSDTLQRTVDLARELYSFGNVMETSASILLPIPGSNSFDQLMHMPCMAAKHEADLLDLEELKVDWIRNFTSTSPDELETAMEQILDTFPLNNTFIQKEVVSAPTC